MKIRKLEQYFLRALQLKNRSVSREEGSEVCQSVFEVVTCTRARQPGGFSPLPPIKIENYVEQTLRHLHKSTYWIDGCVSNPSSGRYTRGVASTRVHVCTRASTFKSLDLAARSPSFSNDPVTVLGLSSSDVEILVENRVHT